MLRPARTLLAITALLALVVACAPGAEDSPAPADDEDTGAAAGEGDPETDDEAPPDADGEAAEAGDLEVVRIATLQSSSDAPFFIADASGYFEDVGIEAEFVPFSSSTEMMAPLGQGEVDVGGGGLAASMFNAIARGVELRIVAEKGTSIADYGYPLMVRSDLVEEGEVQGLADLDDRVFAVSGHGAVLDYLLAKGLEGSGVAYGDVTIEGPIGFPEQVSAFENAAIDASILIEPFATVAETQGVATRLTTTDEWAENEPAGITMFGEPFIEERRDVAVNFMKAYIRANRDLLEALDDGAFAGPNADEVIDILLEYANVDDRAVLETLQPTGADPNARMSLEVVDEMLEFWTDHEFIEEPGAVEASDAVDTSFVEEALEDVGEVEGYVEW